MIQFVVLAVWILAGVTSAALLRQPDQSRLAFAPIAMILGPLWLAVAAEQQQLAPASLEVSSRAHRH